MGQVTIYLDSETEKKLKNAAKSNQISVSKWVSSIIQEHVKNEWPQDIAELAGSWKDKFPSLDEIRSSQTNDIRREEL